MYPVGKISIECLCGSYQYLLPCRTSLYLVLTVHLVMDTLCSHLLLCIQRVRFRSSVSVGPCQDLLPWYTTVLDTNCSPLSWIHCALFLCIQRVRFRSSVFASLDHTLRFRVIVPRVSQLVFSQALLSYRSGLYCKNHVQGRYSFVQLCLVTVLKSFIERRIDTYLFLFVHPCYLFFLQLWTVQVACWQIVPGALPF